MDANLVNNLGNATLIGIVEGFTEYLPVSSTGHMILVSSLLNFEGEKAKTFEIFIQLGAILAVVVLYFKRFLALLRFREAGFNFSREATPLTGIPGLVKLALTCAPAALVGLVFHKAIKEKLFYPTPVAAALLVGGLLMIYVEKKQKTERVHSVDELTYRDALIVGIFQCLALWPGFSRSGSMIVGGLLLGFNRVAAAEYSFLVAVPMMILATGFDLLKSRDLLSADDFSLFAVGFVVAFVTAVIAVKFFIGLLKRFTLTPFAIYRIVLALAVFALLQS